MKAACDGGRRVVKGGSKEDEDDEVVSLHSCLRPDGALFRVESPTIQQTVSRFFL